MIELIADDVLANYDAQLGALAGKTAEGSAGHEIYRPEVREHDWIVRVRKWRTPWWRRLWRAIQRRIPW